MATGANAGLSFLLPIKILLTELERKACTADQLAAVTGLNLLTVYRYLRFFHKRPNLVFVEDWIKYENKRGNPTALWRAGYMMPDTPKPLPLTRRQTALRKRLSKERNLP